MAKSFPCRALGIVLLGLLLVPAARAHDPLQCSVDTRLRENVMEIDMVMSGYATQFLLADSANRPPLGPDNFEDYQAELQQTALGLFTVTAAGHNLEPKAATVELTEEEDIEFLISYPLPPAGPLRLRINFLGKMPDGYTTSMFVQDQADKTIGWEDLDVGKDWLDVTLPSTAAAPAPVQPVVPQTISMVPPPMLAARLMERGAWDMMTGLGHVLFLCGLLAAGRNLRSTMTALVCFALAHSATLALATLGSVTFPTRLIEPLIAVSVVFVGIENLARRGEPGERWVPALAFGLIHGLGFAGAFKETGAGSRPGPLAAYNLGLELGLVAVAALLLVVLWRLRARPAFVRIGMPVFSSALAVIGTCSLVHQTLFS